MNGIPPEVNGNTAQNILTKEPKTLDENDTDELGQNAVEISLDTASSANIPLPARICNGLLDSTESSVKKFHRKI